MNDTTIAPTTSPTITPPSDVEATKTIRGELLLKALHIGLEKVLKETVDPASLRFIAELPNFAVVCDTKPRAKRKRAKKAAPPSATAAE